MFDIVEYLNDKGAVVKPAGGGNVRTRCFFHDEDENKPGKLYINVDDPDRYGLYFCFVCNEKGNVNGIRAHYGDPAIKTNSEHSINPIYEIAAAYYHELIFKNFDQYEYLTDKRGLSDETIVQAKIGWADGNLGGYLISKGYTSEQIKESGLVKANGYDYFKDQIIFPYRVNGLVTQLRGKEIGGPTKSMFQAATGLYNSDSIIGEKTVVACEGEIDTLTMQQLGFNVVGLPGVHNWKDEWTELLEDAKRVYILFDADSAGKSGAEKLAGKLGPKARVVELPKKGIDANDYFVKFGKDKGDFDYLFSKAKGGLLVTVSQSYDAWTQIEGNSGLVGLRFNIGALDKAMGHGLLPGQVMTLLARTNVGKSIWCINMFHRMRLANPDIRILFVSLEQTRNEWFERAHRIHSFYDPGVGVLDTVDYWKDNLLLVDKNKISEIELIDCMDQYTYEAGEPADLTLIDYLGYYARSFKGNSKEQTTDAIMGLKSIAKDFKTVIAAPAQANRTGEIGEELTFEMAKDAAAIEETSDLMLSLWSPDQKIMNDETRERSGVVKQRILKSRNGGVGSLMEYQFAPLTLAMVPYDDILYDQAKAEREYALAGDNWRQAVKRHLTHSLKI